MISDITGTLFSDSPKETLYHYTSFRGLMGIVSSSQLWASDIRYMNDAAELRHTVDLIQAEISRRMSAGCDNPALLNRFLHWVSHRITNGHMLFGASFRANGNLLSQWRGYSTHGKGVSLGFDPQHIERCARQQGFEIGRCIYGSEQQSSLIAHVVDEVESLAEGGAIEAVADELLFAELESDLLRLAAILKHPSFQEEQEWRLISPIITDYQMAPVRFREGTSMLVPYLEFDLCLAGRSELPLEHVYLGPTPNQIISMNSLTLYLNKYNAGPSRGVEYCRIPFRQK